MARDEIKKPGRDITMQKIEDMMKYAFPQIDKFPRCERSYGGMATKLRTVMMNMAERCLDTKKCYYAKSVLKELNELDKEIAYGKFYVKAAYDMKLLPMKQFSIINDYLEQIGKMTGSWINTIMDSEKMKGQGQRK